MTLGGKNNFKQVTSMILLVATAIFAISLPLIFKISVVSTWIFCFAAIAFFVANRKFYFHKAYLFPILFFVFCLVGFLLENNLKPRVLESPLSFLVIASAFSLITFSQKQVRTVLLTVFYAYMAICVLILTLFVYKTLIGNGRNLLDVLQIPKWYVYEFFPHNIVHEHPSFLAVILSFIIPLAFYLRYTLRAIKAPVLLLGVFFLLGCSYIVGARIAMLVNLALILFSFVFYFKKIGTGVKIVGAIMGVTLLTLAQWSDANYASDPIRKELRKVGIHAIKEHPIKGSGYWQMKPYLEQADYSHTGVDKSLFIHDHFHNQFIDDWVQFGILGLLVLIFFFGYNTFVAFIRKDYLLFCLLITWFLLMNVDHPLGVGKGIITITFWYCFIFCTQSVRAKNDKSYALV